MLRNRAGQTTDHVLEVANKRCVAAAMQPALADDAVLCTDGSGMLAKVASDLGIEHHAVNTSRGEHTRGAWHIQNVNAYHSRFKQWMRRFNGVATAYLPNDLGWFRALDRSAQSGAKPASLLALAVGAREHPQPTRTEPMQITHPVPGSGLAVLTLAQPLTAQALLELEYTVAGTLGMLRRDLLSDGFGAAPEHAVRRPDAAETEYASWLPDPGAVEVASWTVDSSPSAAEPAAVNPA